MTYKGHQLTARTEADGKSAGVALLDSLSTAAGMARKSIIGARGTAFIHKQLGRARSAGAGALLIYPAT